ncbi:uncharacterized protein YjiS (DUF1127 family) [Pseudochelatococcus lubricantis]|uniref:Uncharacterized protein YjiS (DUF1127 family) n=1 Tax=Pseudochelatococcus lubricantis TaxID=1538102 RepID=A0ABX0V6Y2_9HYPH|nr:hypothetical protein [Pseudochelatococcus lubricantis]NIJ60275.1 uncharacterized protein YjiS (DUF1127 family) [Pseudochelatococcus lubricantis]
MSNVIDFPLRGLRSVDPPAVGELKQRVATTLLSRWYSRLAHRHMLRRDLLTQPDSVLADAGWTRDAARKEAGKPIWHA